MAKSSFGFDSVLKVVTSPLPRPVQYALGSRFRFYLALIAIGFAMFFGVIHFGWVDGRPKVTVDRQKIQNLKQEALDKVQQYQQTNPNSNLAPLVSNYLNQNLPATNFPQQYNNGYPAPTGYNTPAPVASHPMVYPQQPNTLQPLTGMPQQYQPIPYQANPYQSPAYNQQPYANNYNNQRPATAPYAAPQYGTPGYNNYQQPAAGYPSATNQYPVNGYPNNNTGYQNYGQPARTSAPQYSAPGFR
jgi:hypothetical protein